MSCAPWTRAPGGNVLFKPNQSGPAGASPGAPANARINHVRVGRVAPDRERTRQASKRQILQGAPAPARSGARNLQGEPSLQLLRPGDT